MSATSAGPPPAVFPPVVPPAAAAALPVQPASGQPDVEALIHGLLPRFYWLLDAGAGGALAALAAVLADTYEELRTSVDGMYDDLFIDTCREAVVPYLGDEVGVTGLAPVSAPGMSDRTWVGRIIGFRRRRGTLATLGRSLAAATGWGVYVQNGFALVGHTQSVRHPGPTGGVMDVAGLAAGDDLDAPWSTASRTVSVLGRPLLPGQPMVLDPMLPAGWPGPAVVSVSVWRTRSFYVTQRTPHAITGGGAPVGRAFTFHPFGLDSPLYTTPVTTDDASQPPSPSEIALPLTAAALQAALDGSSPDPVTVSASDPSLPAVRVASGDLSTWAAPVPAGADAIVDPVLGRLLLARPVAGGLSADYAYGFPGELGGGPYGPPSNFTAATGPTVTLHVSATVGGAGATGNPDHPFPSIEAALAVAPAYLAGSNCYVLIDDSATYTPQAGAGPWVLANQGPWTLRIQSAPEAAPALDGGLDIRFTGDARVELSGLMILGPVTAGGAGVLAVEHCTVPPGPDPVLRVTAAGTDTAMVSMTSCICGPIAAGTQVQLSVQDSIVDGLGSAAIGAPGNAVGSLDVQRTTVFGSTVAATLTAEDSIFTGPVTADRPDTGLVRYCFVGPGSRLPAVIQCQPPTPVGAPPRGRVDRLVPWFTSTRYGDPAYGQLHLGGPVEIATGASLGGEMGAFNGLQQPARASRLPTVLGDMLPAGIAATVTYRS